MKQVITIGRPTHYRPNNQNITACGLVGAEHMAYDPRDCDCLNCQKTSRYRMAMGKK